MNKIIILCLLVLTSCTIEKTMDRKIRRAERKIEKLTIKYPSLIQKDTIHDTFNFITPSIKHDTTFISKPGDTTYIYKDKLRIKYVRIGDTTYIEGECKGDTITQIVEIPIEKIVVRKQGVIEQLLNNSRKTIIYLFIIVLLIITIRFAFNTIIKTLWPLN